MRSLKDKGSEELRAVKNRAARQYGMDRITFEDFGHIDKAIDGLLVFIEEMEETDDQA